MEGKLKSIEHKTVQIGKFYEYSNKLAGPILHNGKYQYGSQTLSNSDVWKYDGVF
jgi:hypothetical protein